MSAQGSCLSLVKYLLFVFNLFFFVLGSLIFCFGIWILIDKNSFMSFVGLSFLPLQIWSKVLAVSGLVTMGVALLGCVGALKEFRSLLGLYFGMLLLLFATEITLGILISTQRVLLERKVNEIAMKTIQNYHSDPKNTEPEESLDYIQATLGCCGWSSPQDWFQISSLNRNKSGEPRAPCSCYNASMTNNSTDVCTFSTDQIYQEGCGRNIQKWLNNNLISIVGICLGIGLLELSFMTLSIFLCRNLDQVYDQLSRYH